MTDAIKLSKSDVSFLKFTSPGKYFPRSVSSSEDGYLVIHQRDAIAIGTIGFQPLSQDKKYVLTQETVEINFKNYKSVLSVADFNFEQPIKNKKIKADQIYELSLSDNYTNRQVESGQDFNRVDWSPLDTIVNKSYLAVFNFDGRLIILGQNKITSIWEKEFDLLEMYHKYYKDNLLTSDCDRNGIIKCSDVNEYMKVKNDLKLISFSWSSVVRQSEQSQYCLIGLMSNSGIITVWRIINDQLKSRCEIVHHFCLKDNHGAPKLIQFCDIHNDLYLITVFYSNEYITAYPYEIKHDTENNKISVINRPEITIIEQMKYTQANKVFWSMKHKTLIIGYESELLFVKIECSDVNVIESSQYWLEIPSSEEISGIAVKENMVYITAHDGYLFALKFDQILENIEMNEIVFESPELNGNFDFISVFVSPNGVHLGFVKIDSDQILKLGKSITTCNIVLIRMMPEKELLNILMDDNKPFSRKQDAVEEMRHMYFNNMHLIHLALQKLGRAESQWDTNTLHNLQLSRYLCIFFGYKLTVNHELSDSGNKHLDFNKIRKLESIIISRNISYWLDGFCELSTGDITKADCYFVLSLGAKLMPITTKTDIAEAIEAGQNKSRTILQTEFNIKASEIDNFEMKCRTHVCPVCDEKCDFNLFAMKCTKNHVIPRCCKSLELCTNNFKQCKMCGANDRLFYEKGIFYVINYLNKLKTAVKFKLSKTVFPNLF